jgi:UDP-N-acetylmuramoyl-tripeptide--D-alanyl-D-alanine ligase
MKKSFKIKFLEFNLKWLARFILWRHQVCVIGITGSIGKTTTKSAIYHLLKTKFQVRETKKNYNNEIGVPLTIIGAESGDDSIRAWLKVFYQAIKTIIGLGEYPKILILELAIDRPGDMQYLLSIVKIDIALVNHITNAHQEFFSNQDAIAKEKGKIVENLKLTDCGGVAILNRDDCRVRKMATRTNGEVMTYGFSDEADLYASGIVSLFDKGKFQGLSFKLNYEGKVIPIRLHHILAEYHIYAILAGIAVANVLKMNIIELAETISSVRPPVGRMNLLDGLNSSLIIDDTYNASPRAMSSAMKTLFEIKSKRKILVLGDMLELGSVSEKEHQKIIQNSQKADIIFLVGRRMQEASQFLNIKSDGKIIQFFNNPMEAGEALLPIIQEGDLILVKGSQGMRMEKVVEKIIENKKDIRQLLCRQNISWIKKPYKLP